MAAEPDEQRGRPGRERHDDDDPRAGDVQQLDARQPEDAGEEEAQGPFGDREREAAAEENTGDRAEQQPGEDLEVDVARRPVRCPGHVQERRGVEDVRPDHLVRAEREDHEERQPEEDAAADRRQADDEPAEDADENGRDLVASCELPVHVPDRLLLEEALRDQPDRAEEQRAAEHLPHHRLDVVAVALGQLHVDPHAEQRCGRGADEHPAGEPRAHVAHAAVLDGADALERGAVGDVRPDRRRRRHAEEEDEQRRHQRAAAHARHPDEHPRQQPEQGVLPGHR